MQVKNSNLELINHHIFCKNLQTMSSALCSIPLYSFNSPGKTRLIGGNSNAPKVILINNLTNQNSKSERFQTLEVKSFYRDIGCQCDTQAADNTKSTTKVSSILCGDCEGNGCIQCRQCKGNGVNLEDHFGGRFKAGGLCWLCRGKKEILCGGCNGAGFRGGYMSTADD
ncbi:hypothetical protein LXL04_028049 [Taraxacum kok-saghyz]